MNTKIIKSARQKKNRPAVSFMLSLFFTGLGQVYNGELSRGLALFILRSLALLAIPALTVIREPRSGITIFISSISVALFISLVSPAEALVRSFRSREVPVRSYNSIAIYLLYAAVSAALTAGIIMVLLAFFGTGVTGSRAGPLLEKGDYILISYYPPRSFERGDLVLLRDGSAVRIMGKPGDTVTYSDNGFSVNNRALTLGHVSDDMLKRCAGDFSGDIICEEQNKRRYAIVFAGPAPQPSEELSITAGPGQLVVARDDRSTDGFVRAVPAASVYARVEGILLSPSLRKIGLSPFLAEREAREE